MYCLIHLLFGSRKHIAKVVVKKEAGFVIVTTRFFCNRSESALAYVQLVQLRLRKSTSCTYASIAGNGVMSTH